MTAGRRTAANGERTRDSSGVSSGVSSRTRAVLESPGRPLDADSRAYFEPRFGHDFGHVRVHDDAPAAASAEAMGAHAYTLGGHVVLGPSSQRRAVLAHELAHVTQQRGTDE